MELLKWTFLYLSIIGAVLCLWSVKFCVQCPTAEISVASRCLAINNKDAERNILFNSKNGFTKGINFKKSRYLKFEFPLILLPRLLDQIAMAENRSIILSFVEDNDIDFALNFIETSLYKHNLDNILFFAYSRNTCDMFYQLGFHCYNLASLKGMHAHTSVNTNPNKIQEISKKTHFIKSQIILQILMLNFTVLLSDVDVIYLKNPFHHFNCSACDIEMIADGSKPLLSYAFTLLHPSIQTIMAFKTQIEIMIANENSTYQESFDQAAKKLAAYIRINTLEPDQFQSGYVYFEEKGHHFASAHSPESGVVVVHNNWVVSKAAKIYRFKENHFWVLDEDQYYSSQSRKYIYYDNPLEYESTQTTYKQEEDALLSALAIGIILNRTVILPKFRALYSDFSLMSRYSIRNFDKYTKRNYREHTFKKNPNVPESVKHSIAGPFIIGSAKYVLNSVKLSHISQTFTPNDTEHGANSQEIKKWFSGINESILYFRCLYNSFSAFTDQEGNSTFYNVIFKALQPSSYRQYNNW